jgi:hypothetical protein
VFAQCQGGGILRAHHGLGFIFNNLLSLQKNTLFPHTNSVPQEPHQPIAIDGLPRLLLYFLSR